MAHVTEHDADLVLCRSDCGDGGWSLHPAGSTDEQIASGDSPVLVSGPAQWDDDEGDWDRPNAQDYAKARGELDILNECMEKHYLRPRPPRRPKPPKGKPAPPKREDRHGYTY